MAAIELAPLSHRLDDEEIRLLAAQLEKLGAPRLPKMDDSASHTIGARLSDDAMTEFMDRLDAHDVGADLYLPIEFDGRVTVGDYRVASVQALADALEELKEELDVDEDEDDDEDDEVEDDEDEDDEEEDEGRVIEAQLKRIWHLVADGVAEAQDRGLPLHVQI